jgi:hypothetical protein
MRTYDVDCFVDCSEATSADFFHFGEASNSVRLPRASGSRRLRSRGLHFERESPAQASEAGLRAPASTILSAIDVVVDKS